jgi:hypothetical protein
MKARTILLGTALFFLSFAIAVTAKAQTTTAAFQQAAAAYQQAPSSDTLLNVIKAAGAMRQPPPIPEEARHHFVRDAALFKAAKSQDDFLQAASEFHGAYRRQGRHGAALGCSDRKGTSVLPGRRMDYLCNPVCGQSECAYGQHCQNSATVG